MQDGAPGTAILLGKQLLPVMTVMAVTSITAEQQPIQELLCKHQIEVCLWNASTLKAVDGCFTSPYLHCPAATLQRAAQPARRGSTSAHASKQVVRPGKWLCKALQRPPATCTSLFASGALQMAMGLGQKRGRGCQHATYRFL